MKVQLRSKVVRRLTPKCQKHLLNWPNQKSQVLDLLRQLPQTEEFFGSEHRIETKVRIPETWTELREGLRNLIPKRNYGIDLIYRGKCHNCEERFDATSPRKNYCSNECEKKAEYKKRLERGDFKKGMLSTRQNKRHSVNEREVKQKQIIEEKENLLVENLYEEVVFGKLDKKNRSQYYNICRQLAYGDEVRGYKKIEGWYKNKLKFAQIPTKDQNILITWVRDQK